MCSTSSGMSASGEGAEYQETPPDYSLTQDINCTSESTGDSIPLERYYSPSMDSVTTTLRWGFYLHAYGFAFLFFFLAFYSFFSILNLRSQLSARPYMTTINSFLCLLGASRAAVLFIDPYGLKHTLPGLIESLVWDLGFPSLISSFSLIQIAFLQLTQPVLQHRLCQSQNESSVFIVSQWNNKPYLQLEVGPDSFRKKTCLSLVITLHFMSIIISAIYTNLNYDLMLGKLITQLLFGIWGFVLCGSFLVAKKRVLGILGTGSGGSESAPMSTHNDKGIANLFGMGMMGQGQNLASSLTAALAPTLLQASSASTTTSSTITGGSNKDTPKIKVTDEHDRPISFQSDSSRLNDIPEIPEGPSTSSGPSGSPRSSISGPTGGGGGPPSVKYEAGRKDPDGSGSPTSGQGSTYVRPPSPVLPRRKSTGGGLRGGGSGRKLSWNARRESGDLVSTPTGDKEIRKKSLTWSEIENATTSSALDRRRASRKSIDANGTDSSTERNGGTESLLSSVQGPDYTLQSILSHIAYVNQTALDYRLSRKLSRTNQVHRVVKFTSVTAALGFALCIGELIRILSPYGMLASDESAPGVWPWFILNTFCRLAEFAMGATIANITKQPVTRPHHYAYSIRHKHHRESSLYL